jgi:hypothetical protein
VYLCFIGIANLVGVGLLLGALSERFADRLLRRWTQIIAESEPYRHSSHSRLWLWWAAVGTGFYGAINCIAATWPVQYARIIAWGNVYAYGAFELLAIAATRSPRYGKGIRVAHVLWIGQAGWGVWVAMS